MQARVGDRIVIRGHHVGEPIRDGEILETRGPEGGPPYIVRWGDTGHEMLPRALSDDAFDVIMVGFNLVNPSARGRVFPLTLKHDVGTLIMFAVRRQLSDPAALREAVAGLVERGEVDGGAIDADDPLGFLREHADSVVEAAYRFCRHEPGAQVILTGTGEIAHLEENLKAIQGPPLPEAVQSRLAAIFGRVDSVSGN